MMMFNYKRAQTWNIIRSALLALIVLALLILIVRPFLKNSGQASDYHITENLLQICKMYGESGKYDDTDYGKGGDGDGLPNFCDNCPKINNDEEDDLDGDLFPNGCLGNNGKGQPSGDTEKDDDARVHPDYKWKGDVPEEEE